MRRSRSDSRLIDACRQSGCPVCRCIEEDGRRHVDALLHELVTDHKTRTSLRASWGFCAVHGAMTLATPGARTGVAILHADVIRTVAERIRRAQRAAVRPGRGDWRRRMATALFSGGRNRRDAGRGTRATCLVCESTAHAEERYFRTLDLVGGDDTVTRAYDASDGLCLPHLHRAMGRGRTTTALVERTLCKWDELATLLDDFVRKHEYRSTDAFTESEARACERAVETLSGRPGWEKR